MAFTIMQQMSQPGYDMYYEPGFRLLVETYLNILKNFNATIVAIPPDKYYQYEGNFYGYLVELQIAPCLHWIYMRVNGMENPDQFAAELRLKDDRIYNPTLLHPNKAMIETISMYYNNRKF